ncbi:MAG: SIR2 family protein [Candidatus Binatia bacterium]
MKPDETKNMEAAKMQVAKKIKEENCILFLGAGVHSPPPKDSPWVYPEEHRPLLGQDLAKKLDAECHYREEFPEESCLDLQRVSLCFEEHLSRDELVDGLNRHLRDGKKPSPALMMLAGLPFKIFVTTNYDRLLESALSKFEKDPVTFVYNPHPDPNKPIPDMTKDPTVERPLLFKMHGDLNQRDSIVITDEDYITFVQRMSDKEALHPVPRTVRFRMQRWPMLFVGYSLRDYNFRLIFRTLRWNVDPANFPRSFSVDRSPDPLILQVWQNEMKFVTFVTQDLWTFVPWLFKEVNGKEYKHE